MNVSIVGKGTGWQDAPQEGEVWGICQQLHGKHRTRIIDMNDYGLWGEFEAQLDRISRKKAAQKGIPYYDLASYPIQEVVAHFGVDYFSNTVDYAIALSIYERFTEIDLYGVNMAVDSEYAFEKPGVDFWCGVAVGRGVNLTVHGGMSTIIKTRDGLLYGYGTPQQGRIYANTRPIIHARTQKP